jgi:hypothetical protein
MQEFRAPVRIDVAPGFLGCVRRGDRDVDLGGTGFDDLAHAFLGCGIDYGKSRGSPGFDQTTSNAKMSAEAPKGF